jgi:hypothetical protein
MTTTRRPSDTSEHSSRLELTVKQGHTCRRTLDGGKFDRNVVALVKLLARLAAEEDFRDEPHRR